jgi:hypothetical protein
MEVNRCLFYGIAARTGGGAAWGRFGALGGTFFCGDMLK